MRKYLLIIVLLFKLNSKSQGIYIDPSKLSWSDYIGDVDYFSPYIALTKSGMTFWGDTIKGKVTFRVYPVILKNLSWINYQKLMKEKDGYSTYLLEHERLHYYISILNARKLKVCANEHPPKNRDEIMNLMIYYANKNQGDQDAYDEATKHAYLKDKQEEWSKKIMTEYEATDSIKLDLP